MQPKSSSWKFIPDRRKPVYKTLAAELDAVARKKKTISYFATDQDGLREDHAIIEAAAAKKDLEVNVAKRGDVIDIFVHRVGDFRRVQEMLVALSKKPWTFEHEENLGILLGYTPAQRKAWLAAERHARPAFGVLTLYAEIVTGYPFPLEWWSDPGRVAAPDAFTAMDRSVPGLQLWRVGMDPAYAKHLDAKGFVSLAGAPKKVQTAFDKAVRTPLELLGPKGWHRPARSQTRLRGSRR